MFTCTDMIPLLILACCILHNICIDNEDEPFDAIEAMEDETNYNYNYRIIEAEEEKRHYCTDIIMFPDIHEWQINM